MKKFLALALALCFVFLAACAASAPETGGPSVTETATRPATVPATGSGSTEYPVITLVPGWEELDAIPVAKPGMTEDELRQIVVEEMLFQLGLVWTPSGNNSYSYPSAGASDGNGMLHFYTGMRYGGLPYSQAGSDVTALMDRLDPKTGVLNTKNLSIMDEIGNNCATAVFWAWARVSTTQKGVGTQNLCPANNVILLGNLKAELNGNNYDYLSTKAIGEINGAQALFEAYASMKPADGFVGYVPRGQHHAMLLIESPKVVRKADGSIDGAKSTVVVGEQYSGIHSYRTADGNVSRVGGLANEYTFSQLFKKYYVPISVAELLGSKAIEEASARVDLPDQITLEDLKEAKVESNYTVSRIATRFYKEDGSLAYEILRHGKASINSHVLTLFKSSAFAVSARRALGSGSFRVEVEVRLANGEYFTPYEGVCTVS